MNSFFEIFIGPFLFLIDWAAIGRHPAHLTNISLQTHTIKQHLFTSLSINKGGAPALFTINSHGIHIVEYLKFSFSSGFLC